MFSVRVVVEGHAGDRVLVHLEDVVVVELLLDRGPRARGELVLLDRAADELLDGAHVAPPRAADLLVVVDVDERPDPLVREHLGEQPLVHVAVDHVDPGDARLAGRDRVAGLRGLAGVHRPLLERVGELGHRAAGGRARRPRRGRPWW